MGAMNQIEEEKSKLREKTMDLQANLEVSVTSMCNGYILWDVELLVGLILSVKKS